ncbi:hypothetical protein SAMN03159448_04863 [Sinorhizobium sp. NFACC03]|nr:hypothetical protein SAMN03159448_04863 [Sinorhizobium sp. NFACC03]
MFASAVAFAGGRTTGIQRQSSGAYTGVVFAGFKLSAGRRQVFKPVGLVKGALGTFDRAFGRCIGR